MLRIGLIAYCLCLLAGSVATADPCECRQGCAARTDFSSSTKTAKPVRHPRRTLLRSVEDPQDDDGDNQPGAPDSAWQSDDDDLVESARRRLNSQNRLPARHGNGSQNWAAPLAFGPWVEALFAHDPAGMAAREACGPSTTSLRSLFILLQI
jgi:hypothetical protein